MQTQLARLQEEGRYAITRISGDISASNSQYCTNTGGNAHLGSGGVYLDGLRAATVYAAGNALMAAINDNTTPWGAGNYPAMPTAPYSLPAFLSMRGYDCTITACLPLDPSTVTFTNPLKGQSQNIGDRVLGSSILTMRYINPAAGWTIYPTGSATGSTVDINAADGSLKDINLKPIGSEPPITNVKANDLMMLANCSSGQIFAVTGQGSATLTPATVGSGSGSNFAVPSGQAGMAAPVLFDLNTDFQTVTYYLRVVQGSDGVSKTGALIRRVNGVDSDPIVTGTNTFELTRAAYHLGNRHVALQVGDGWLRLLDRINALDLGADDYLVKPFALPELAARCRALIRRATRAGRTDSNHPAPRAR